MPDTFQALGVLSLALLPGALYTWSFERQAGAWGVRLADRALRFLGVSAIFHALTAPVTYVAWARFVAGGRLVGGHVPLGLWVLALLYVGIPTGLGSLVGRATRARRRWARLFTGPNPAPRAWDHLFAAEPDGWIRLRLKGGVWLGGAFAARDDGSRSCAAGYPEDQDLFLVEAVELDPDSGEFLRDEDGRPLSRSSAILIRWAEVEYLEFIEG